MRESLAQRHAIQIAQQTGLLTARQVEQARLHRQALTRLVRLGRLERVERGCYRLVGHPLSEHHGLVLAATTVPKGVVCLLSALSFHQIGTQVPSAIWVAVDRRSRLPSVSSLPMRFARFSGAALSEGIETHELEGREVKIYSVAKTLADIFKYRHKVGLEVALEALRDAWQSRRFTLEELDHYARLCRVEKVMGPYLESLLV